MKLGFERVTGDDAQVRTLYDLLRSRVHAISHASLPDYAEHSAFVRGHPYRAWYLVRDGSECIGSVYVTDQNTIGINVDEARLGQCVPAILEEVRSGFRPLPAIKSVRAGHFTVNVPPGSVGLMSSLARCGCTVAQVSFRVPGPAMDGGADAVVAAHAPDAPHPGLGVRPAAGGDSIDVWQWRNDETTRRMSASQDVVGLEAHATWYERALSGEDTFLYIGHAGGEEKIGMCRFDLDLERGVAQVSINLNPRHRGKGLSSWLLCAAIAQFPGQRCTDLVAKIRKENIGSIKCFTRCGFVLEREDGGFAHYRRRCRP